MIIDFSLIRIFFCRPNKRKKFSTIAYHLLRNNSCYNCKYGYVYYSSENKICENWTKT